MYKIVDDDGDCVEKDIESIDEAVEKSKDYANSFFCTELPITMFIVRMSDDKQIYKVILDLQLDVGLP